MNGVHTPAGVVLFTGLELNSIERFPDDHVVFVQDHIGSGDGPDTAQDRFLDLLENQSPGATVAIEYARADEITQQNSRVICWPIQTWFVCQTLARFVPADAWAPKSAAFNFMVNKPRPNRVHLVDQLNELGIDTEYYSMPWPDRGSYQRRCWINPDMTVTEDQILNGNVSNVEIYQAWLKSQVFEPTVISLVTEPAWHEQAFFVSEKTVWAWEAGTIPIWVGSWAAADTMADLGFDPFYDIVDHAYQRESDPERRLRMAVECNQDLLRDTERCVELWHQHRDRFEFNRRHMRSGEWLQELVMRELRRTDVPAADLAQLMFYTLSDHSNYESNLLTQRQNCSIMINHKE